MSDAPTAQTQAGGYERRIGRYRPELAAAFTSAAGIEPGDRVLDVGCGTGALTIRLVELLGAGNVAGIDPAADDIAACAERCPGVDLRVGEAESLPYDDREFDAALAQLVVGHLRDAERAVREMARVVRRGAWSPRASGTLPTAWCCCARSGTRRPRTIRKAHRTSTRPSGSRTPDGTSSSSCGRPRTSRRFGRKL